MLILPPSLRNELEAPVVAKQHKRKAIVFVSLVGVLTLTSSLLLVLAPAPLRPGAASTLFNADSPSGSYQAVFQTDRPIESGRWKSLLIRTAPAGASGTSGDHFTLSDAQSGADGQIEISARWMSQLAALPPAGTSRIDPGCVSISVRAPGGQPTRLQQERLAELVAVLQRQLDIPNSQVWRVDASLAGR